MSNTQQQNQERNGSNNNTTKNPNQQNANRNNEQGGVGDNRVKDEPIAQKYTSGQNAGNQSQRDVGNYSSQNNLSSERLNPGSGSGNTNDNYNKENEGRNMEDKSESEISKKNQSFKENKKASNL